MSQGLFSLYKCLLCEARQSAGRSEGGLFFLAPAPGGGIQVGASPGPGRPSEGKPGRPVKGPGQSGGGVPSRAQAPSEGKPGRPVEGLGRCGEWKGGFPWPRVTFRGEARSPGGGSGPLQEVGGKGFPSSRPIPKGTPGRPVRGWLLDRRGGGTCKTTMLD